MIADPVAVLVVLSAVVYLAVRLEERYRVFRSLGSALVGILGCMLLSNVGILPGESPTYEFLLGTGVSVGIALILFSVDVRTVFSAGPRMLAAFGIGTVGTATGAVAGALVWSGMVGPETWKLAGQFTGTYTGGGVNFAALGEALGTSSDLFTAAIAADVTVTAIWMAACLAAPLLLGRWNPRGGAPQRPADQAEPVDVAEAQSDEGPATLERTLFASERPVRLSDTAALVTLGIGTVWGAELLGSLLPSLPDVLWLTTLALLLAQVPAIRRLAGSAMLGNYLVLLFRASNGAQSVIANIFEVGPGVFYYAATTVAVHGIVIFGAGRLAGLDPGTLAVASQANVGGAASAMAMASARGYADKLLPGVAVGLLGYAVGNYLGYTVAQIMRPLLGG